MALIFLGGRQDDVTNALDPFIDILPGADQFSYITYNAGKLMFLGGPLDDVIDALAPFIDILPDAHSCQETRPAGLAIR